MKLCMFLALASVVLFVVSQVSAREIGFVENFGIAENRAEALKQLIPGTEEYYFFSCVNAQHTGNFDQVNQLLKLWIERYGETPQVKEILNRQALLEYEKNPQKSLEYIRQQLGLRFDHSREITESKTSLPTKLDQELISIPVLTEQAFSHHGNLEGIEDAGLDILEHAKLDPERRRNLLQRLQRPDIPNLPKLVVDDLKYEHSGGFGSHPIHNQLLQAQLDECLKLMPELVDNSNFISAYISKLAPSDDIDIRYDFEEKKAYLNRLWNYVKGLAPAHNSLKAHVLYAILDLNRAEGNYDQNLFMEYIQLPREVPYINPDYLKQKEFRDVRANLNSDFQTATRLSIVGADEALVRDYLTYFLVNADNYTGYVKFIRDNYLKDVFVETKILNDIGDMEKWYSLMTPDRYQSLKERVDLDFAATNKKIFGTDELVVLDLFVKNIKTLIVKIFELNAFNYFQSNLQEIDTAINLDGLVATEEKVMTYTEPPLRRVRRTFEFPQIKGSGVFVAEFIGSGKSSRVVVRKGKLYFADRIGPSGHEFVILNEKNEKRPQTTIWLSGREFKPDLNGVITIPFSSNPGRQKIILKDGSLCSLAEFEHLSENYSLSAGFYVDRESLLKRFNAKVMLRPVLTLNGHPISLSLLENTKLSIESVDRNGVSTTKEVAPFELFETKESVFEFQVPENLAKIRFTLKAQVKNLSQNKKQDMADSSEFLVNGIDAALSVEDVFLSHVDNSYLLELLGKNGEVKPERPVNIELKHRYFRETIHITLQTDQTGRIQLGRLADIEWIRATGPEGAVHVWPLTKDLCRYPNNLHSPMGKAIRLPYMGLAEKETRLNYVLLEKRGQTWLSDRTDAIQINDGFLNINGLSSGDYDLYIKTNGSKITLRLTDGKEENFFTAGRRILEIKNPQPLQISSVDVGLGTIKVKLGHASEFARLHVLATRFMPSFHPLSYIGKIGLPEPWQARITRPETLYVAGRNIGDEYRYILDRKYAEKFPGNMLDRPGLLLNPWSIRKTETAKDEARPGEAFAKKTSASDARLESASRDMQAQEGLDSFSSFDFLGETSALLLNLKPDDNGIVAIDRKLLGAHAQLHLVAVDPLNTVYREVTLSEPKAKKRDLRLIQGLNAEKHFTEQKQISLLNTGETFTMRDISASEFEVYDSLGKVYRLLVTLSGNTTLQEFDFILRWHEMNRQEKEEKYSTHACHELNFFIFHKDREFFDQVIKPYLANKKDKTFMDHWLLGNDLSVYLQSWQFSQLNIAERILLTKRGPADKARIERHVKELFDMIPPDVDAYNRLFDTALKGRALEGDDAFGVAAAKELAAPAPAAVAVGGVEADMLTQEEALNGIESVKAAPAPPAKRAAAPAPAMKMKKQAQERKDAGKAEAAGEKGAYFRGRQEAQPQEPRQFYQKLDKTLEWVENNYYKLPIEQQKAELITVNAFWKDYAQAAPNPSKEGEKKEIFLSTNFFYAAKNFSEIMLALSVLDLPFKPEKHESKVKENTFTLKAGSPLIVFHKEIEEGRPSEDKIPILASQNIFNPNDRYRFVDNEQFDKFIEGECLFRAPYGCQVVMSNPTSSRHKLRVLLQIPHGAIPLNNGFYTKSIPITLEPFSTRTFEYSFYFPETGKFKHYPVQITKNEQFISSTMGVELNAVAKLTKVDTESWDYVSQNSSDAEVLEFLRTHNINRLNLDKIAYRVKNKGFFEKTIALLQERHTFHSTLWSYSIFHNIPKTISEYLKHTDYANRCGDYIDTPVLRIDSTARKIYQHKEYKPLVNARAHQLGKERKILNDRFYEQYHQFMKMLCYYPSLDNEALMAVTYYLLLQDRVDEAIRFFKRIDAAKIEDLIQYDYIKTYLAFYQTDIDEARKVIAKYTAYPVPRWHNMFKESSNHLEEMEGKGTEIVDKESREQIQAKLAATEPGLELKIESRKITINYQNLTTCRVNYYPMDIELLFSRNPFVQQQTEYFAFIKPNETAEVQLPESQKTVTFDLPEAFHNSNLMVEVAAGGIKKSQVYYANSLDIQVVENYGQLKVALQTTHKPLPKVYVKVYARMKDGTIQFYKDGYTDLRGRFDYVSLNTNEIDYVEKLAILVLSEEYGAAIREAGAPKR